MITTFHRQVSDRIFYSIHSLTVGKVQTVKVVGTSAERKTAENVLARYINGVINLLEIEWDVEVVAVTSDESGESRTARQLLGRDRPEIMIPPGLLHFIFLIACLIINIYRMKKRLEPLARAACVIQATNTRLDPVLPMTFGGPIQEYQLVRDEEAMLSLLDQ